MRLAKITAILKTQTPRWMRITVLTCLCLVTFLLVVERVGSSWSAPSADFTMQQRLRYLQDEQRTLDLAIEFGYDPLIVKVVRQSAAATISKPTKNRLMWRLLRTSDELAFVMLALIKAESGGNPYAVSTASAYGLTQLQIPTARMYDTTINAQALFSIEQNIRVAFLHFEYLMNRYNGNWPLVLLMWNRGEGRVIDLIRSGQSPNNGYVNAVLVSAMSRSALALRNAQ